ncbi:MAG TPA: flagellar hook-length control protein FliK [Rhizobacter sp.]
MNPAISSFVPPVAPQAPVPSAPPSSSSPGFSQMLNQAQARESEAAAPDTAPETAPKPAQAGERGRADKAGKGEKTPNAEGGPRTERAEGDDAAAEASAATEATDDTPAADPALADWLALLQRPAAPPDETAGKAAIGQGEADAALSGKGGAARGASGAAARDLKAQDNTDAVRDLQARATPTARELAEATSFKATMAQVDEGHREAQPAQELPSASAVTAAGLPTAAGATRAGETAAPVSVQVPTPATSPEFAHKLGVQVSVLAKDGIQQAELHLNPAEMGPISIQIAIEGTQAQVNFGADSAATRQIIENGLPELAASLREAGFTLSGGGVHSQARGREQGEGDGPRERSGSRIAGATETDVTPQRVTSRVSAGGVDVYA